MANQSDNLPVQPVSIPDPAPGTSLGGMRRIAPREPGKSQTRLKVRRGRSVRVLKVALPLIVFVTLGYVGYWWLQARGTIVDPALMQGVPKEDAEKAEVTVNDVQYDGVDDKGRPFSVTAEAASHVDGDDRHISLKKPMADIVMSGGSYVALTANDGLLDRDADIITLTGDVTLFHDNGLSFQTESATIDLDAKTAEGNETVEGQNGDGELVSEGFRVRDDGDTIVFTGKAYMKIYPKQKEQGG